MPKEAKLTRAPTSIQGPRTWRKVDPVVRRATGMPRRLSRSIRPHPHRQSRTMITGNSAVCEQLFLELFHPHRFFRERSDFYCFRSCPGGSPPQQERTEHCRREQIELEVDRIRHSQAITPRSQRIRRRLRSAQICRWRPLFYPGKLRGMALLLHALPPHLQAFQRTKANKQAIESLAPRIKGLSASLCALVSEGDFKERARREELEK